MPCSQVHKLARFRSGVRPSGGKSSGRADGQVYPMIWEMFLVTTLRRIFNINADTAKEHLTKWVEAMHNTSRRYVT